MKFDIITLFPKTIEGLFAESIIHKASEKGLVEIGVHDLRKYTDDKRKTVDARPFGGGAGMLMMVEPIYKALKDLGAYPRKPASAQNPETPFVVLTSAAGTTWSQQLAQDYSTSHSRIIIICGHYEGVDHRVSEHLVDAEISIGNFVLTGGELAAGVLVDSISRLLPGVVGNENSLIEESHATHTNNRNDSNKPTPLPQLEYPQYTRPAEFTTEEGDVWSVPGVLISGHHEQIKAWRKSSSTK